MKQVRLYLIHLENIINILLAFNDFLNEEFLAEEINFDFLNEEFSAEEINFDNILPLPNLPLLDLRGIKFSFQFLINGLLI
jgi:hypothetical protein